MILIQEDWALCIALLFPLANPYPFSSIGPVSYMYIDTQEESELKPWESRYSLGRWGSHSPLQAGAHA